MKSLVILYAGNSCDYACKPFLGGKTAAELSLEWAQNVPDVSCVAILESSITNKKICSLSLSAENITFKHISSEKWTISSLLKTMDDLSEGFDYVVYGFIDTPFYDKEITQKLINTHTQYGVEYTFADGYPKGLSPEILNPGTIHILANLAKENTKSVTKDSIFSVLQTDINSFEIETEIAPKDLRYLRLNLDCETKRNAILCERLFEMMKDQQTTDICSLVENTPSLLRTVPAYYSLQIAVDCSGGCTFCPYPAAVKAKYGKNPGACNLFMKEKDFAKIIKKIYEFSDDAVISLSLWGEATRHPLLKEFIAEVLKYPSLSLLIETTGENLTDEKIAELAECVKNAPERTNGQKPLNWIVSLDASKPETYEKLHGENNFDMAKSVCEKLFEFFGDAVYPQFLRLIDNEDEMETFYRSWKEKCNNVIIQKYDNFCGVLPDKKVADLTPVNRSPCWHLRRDLSILVDGSVPFCKEALLDGTCGNAYTDSFEDIWNKNNERFAEHVRREYSGICGSCDEYYTFNF